VLLAAGGALSFQLVPALSGTVLGGIPISGIAGWVGAATALAGALMALFQEDIKYSLAYSSMGQMGYMVLAFAMLSHLGHVTGLYLAVIHLMVKLVLWIAVLGVIQQTGTRLMYQMGGLVKKMPLTFISVLFGIIVVSGVPPLAGFGGKWLLYTALLERGWYLQAGLAFFASAVAFLYLYRLIHSIFLGQPKDELAQVKEAPFLQLLPQLLLLAALMGVSMFPNLLLKPLQTAVEPMFAATVRWEGYRVISSLGYWNGNAVMYVTMGVFMVPLIWLLIVNGRKVTRVSQFNIVYAAERPYKPETTHYGFNFFGHYRKALGGLAAPWGERFWTGLGRFVRTVGDGLRRWNTGNPQTYGFQILLFLVIILLAAAGGLS
jgi:formate hydrogenlyase subunit 3/multisubunit Na+/H+ antiporter MnhD subunit